MMNEDTQQHTLEAPTEPPNPAPEGTQPSSGRLDSEEPPAVSPLTTIEPPRETPGESEKILSEKKLAANRADAKLSTGPASEEGKNRSRFNAVKHGLTARYFVSAKRTPSCKDSRRTAMLRHDQALKEGVDEVAKAGFRAGM